MRRRRSLRLEKYNYAQPGAFFVTICTLQRECLFGEVRDGEMYVNAAGDLIEQAWLALPQRFPGVSLDAFVVMPNHVHGVICNGEMNGGGLVENVFDEGVPRSVPTLCLPVGALLAAPHATKSRLPASLADIVRAFKSLSAIAANRLLGRQGQPLWQRNYYERIIRDDDEWNRIREYIITNPQRWDQDTENPDA